MPHSSTMKTFCLKFIILSYCVYQAVSSEENRQTFEENGGNPKSHNILILSLPGIVHLLPILAVGEELVLRGHNVTLCTGQLSEDNEEKLVQLATKAGVRYISNGRESGYWQQTTIYKGAPSIKGMRRLAPFRNEINGMVSFWFEELANEMTEKRKWDIILFDDILMPAAMCIHNRDKIPAILIGTTLQSFPHLSPPWPWPHSKTGNISDNLSFLQRFRSEFAKILGLVSSSMRFLLTNIGSEANVMSQYCPNATVSYLTSSAGISVPYIVPTVIGFEYARTLTPLSHYVGPLLTKKPDLLPGNLKEWLDSKKHKSVIYVSVGPVFSLKPEIGRAFVEGIRKTDYNAVIALGKTNNEVFEGLDDIDSKRMYVVTQWTPQLSVLQHKAISLAIVHGGFNGIHESLHNGVPLIVVPAFGDQFGNAGRVVNQGLGLSLDASTIIAEKITSSIAKIDSGDYRRNVERLQKIFVSAGGVEKAADLVEYYKEVGFDHLIPAYAKYEWSWVQYYNVDVYALLAVILVSVIYCSLKCCQFVCRRTCCKRKEKKD